MYAAFTTIRLLLLMLLLPLCLPAQQVVQSIEEEFVWDNANETKTLYVGVRDGSPRLKINLEGNITQGKLIVTAHDPEGNKVAGFSLKTSDAKGYEVSVGSSTEEGTTSTIESSSDSDSGETATLSSMKVKKKRKVISKSKSKSRGKNRSGKSYSKTLTSTDSKGAKGVMNKTLTDPMVGRWKIELEVVEVSGSLKAEVSQD